MGTRTQKTKGATEHLSFSHSNPEFISCKRWNN